MEDAERIRLRAADAEGGARVPWREWGPYLAERAWGTVREDYSEGGTAWDYFPHDQARSRAYRWNEDGLGGICDDQQRFCFALAFWNGVDPILKERLFGVSGQEGNHGEDVKEYWWFLDSTPTHSWMRWRYHYPQREFPYHDLLDTTRARGGADPEYELVDTGVFDDDRYWAITADYAKAGPHDMCIRVRVENMGPEPATLQVLPTLWFRNTWSWGLPDQGPMPRITVHGARLAGEHSYLRALSLYGDGSPEALVCDNETNSERLWGYGGYSRFPKDGINDHVVAGADTVNPERVGTKAALRYVLTVPPWQSAEIRLRLRMAGPGVAGRTRASLLGRDFEKVMEDREQEADEFFAALTPPTCSDDEAMVLRQAVGGLMWSKQFYHYNVPRWLDHDPGHAGPIGGSARRNAHWWHMSARDVIAMPDTWEYPWFAAWDLAFHAVALARVDPGFAKQQLLLLLREWYLHPSGQMPAYEWNFGDVNPPVHAWAALQVFAADGSRDFGFLKRVFHRLLLNFTWWVNRLDAEGKNVFEGGFLGLDNIGPFDRSAGVPAGGQLEQSDGTAWMALFTLTMMDMALALATEDSAYGEMVTKFFEHFALIVEAANTQGLWNEEDGFYYDVIRVPGQEPVPLRVRSVVGLLPLSAAATVSSAALAAIPELEQRVAWYRTNKPHYADVLAGRMMPASDLRLLTMVRHDQLPRLLERMLDEEEFLSDHGLRALSRAHLAAPFTVRLGEADYSVGYEPAESRSNLFGGNSNWRGPIWFPVNYMLIDALDRHHRFFGDKLRVAYPTTRDAAGTPPRRAMPSRKATLGEIADDLSRRLVSLFLNDADGRRPVFGETELFQKNPDWHDLIPFHEYFHGDTGAGLGASHQTGWTALVINLILRPVAGGAGTES
jgi:hypothetical protein